MSGSGLVLSSRLRGWRWLLQAPCKAFLDRPVLALEPIRYVEGMDRSLMVFLKNPPIGRFLRNLGLRRDTIQSLTAHFQIREAGSGTVVAPSGMPAFDQTSDETDIGRERIMLPPTFSVGASLTIVLWYGGHAWIAPDRLRDPEPAPPSPFAVEIIFVVDGEPLKYQGRFVVGSDPDDLGWAPETLERVT